MLVIRRRPGEAIVVAGDTEIEVLEVSASQVKLGIRAPRSVAVVRKEVLLVSEQNRVASEASEAEVSRMVSALNPSSILPSGDR